jgi:hypothetical protein
MPWTARFRKPIVLRSGRNLAILADARDLLLALPQTHHGRPHVAHAAQLLIKAAESAERGGMASASAQMVRALQAEGLL